MTDRVSHHAHPPQQEKDSGQGASHCTENSDENDVKVVDGPVHGFWEGSRDAPAAWTGGALSAD